MYYLSSSVHPKKNSLHSYLIFLCFLFFKELPRDSNDAIWEHVKSKYSLSMVQLEALKNYICFAEDDFVPAADGSEEDAAGQALKEQNIVSRNQPLPSSSSSSMVAPPMAASASVPASIAVVPMIVEPPMHFPAAVEEAELACNHCKKTFKSAGGLKYHLQNVTPSHSTIY